MVQKSSDGRNWSDLVWVASQALQGNSYLPLNYTTEDKKTSIGANYYRLQQVNMNGNRTISNVIMVMNNNKQSGVTIYPNPAAGILHIATKASCATQTYIFKNLAGQTVFKGLTNGNNTDINVGGIANGAYILQIGNEQEKVMIVH